MEGGRGFPAVVGAAEDEDVAAGGVEGEEMGEVGGGTGREMEGEAERLEVPSAKFEVPKGVRRFATVVVVVAAGSRRDGLRLEAAATEVEDEGVGGGEFEIGGEGFGHLEEIVEDVGFSLGIAVEEAQLRAAGERAGGGLAGVDAVAPGGAVGVDDRGGAAIDGGGEDGAGVPALLRMVAEEGFEGEAR